ncbi:MULTISPECIES: hypothetical protein [Massilia]|jgi:hypothetical protein|uniref:hypothetical protein n=1 Tax=Massilia TaxID=149698 RepID=UPI0004E394A7|nr:MULTISPECIES: hypothetical protein [Massilia]KFC72590.1 hypothetical protein FG94_01767 [Massilia sp. LC238]
MYPTNPVASKGLAVVLQANIFGGVDEIPINPPKASKATPPGPAPLHDAPASPAKAVKPVKPGLVNQPKPTLSASAQALPAADELLVDPDEPISVDLEAIEASDTPETILAKRMFLRMMWDIEGKSEDVEPDLFGQTSIASDKTSQSDLNRLDALIWLYSLNPDGGLVTIEWVCDVLGFDPHRVRRIVGRSLRKELKRLVHLLSTIVGAQHAQVCEDKISDYLDISNWSFN